MFKTVAKDKRLLMWTLFLIFMLQMPHFALSSSIDTIQRYVFTNKSLAEIQTVISLPNLLSVLAGTISSFLVSFGFATKKSLTITGISVVALTGVIAIILHTQFWQLILFSVLIGLGIGFFIPSSQSIMMDSFDEKERQVISGLQFSFINLGGILMSVVGGLLITLVWYGGYIMLLVMVPVAVMAIIALPQDQFRAGKNKSADQRQQRSKLPSDVFYYSVTLFLFTLIFNVTMSNLPTHLAMNHLGNAGTAGVVIATTMAGGVFSGIFFDRFSTRLGDYLIPISFIILFIGFTLLNVFSASLPLIFIAVFLLGTSTSLCLPQCIFSASNSLDPTNSALASTFLSCVAPGSGGFLSPVIFTNITLLLGGESTSYRYQFVGIVALLAGGVYLYSTKRRDNRKALAEQN